MRDGPPSVVMPLYIVDKVALSRTGEGAVQLHATPPQSHSKEFMGGMMMGGGTGQELLQFDPLMTMRHSDDLGLNEDVGGAIVWLRLLVAWNRRRLVREIEEGRAVIVPRKLSASPPGYITMS